MIRHFNLVNRKISPFKNEIDFSVFESPTLPSLTGKDIKPAIILDHLKELRKAQSKIRIRSTYIKDSWVSTVFLVLDHSHGGKPVLFETMIFEGKTTAGFQIRAETHREALNNHRAAVNKVKGK